MSLDGVLSWKSTYWELSCYFGFAQSNQRHLSSVELVK